MTTPLMPQEVYLLERYISAAYFGTLRDTWAAMLDHVETCFDRFMHNLPLDYRDRPLPEQPDIVWGERVLPNFRDTLQALNDGYILLQGGDLRGLDQCNGPVNDFKGQTEFWSGWMSREDENEYARLLNEAVAMAANIQATEGAYWNPGDLGAGYHVPARGPLAPPPNWPAYRLSNRVRVATDAPLTVDGVYLPDVADSCPQFLHTLYDTAPPARVRSQVPVAPDEQAPVLQVPCTWTLVEQHDAAGPASAPTLLDPTLQRVPAGMPCPRAGMWFTPAQPDSRRRFRKDEIMPSFDSAYGVTIWQWDANQD